MRNQEKPANVFNRLSMTKKLFIVRAAYEQLCVIKTIGGACVRLGKVSLPLATGQKLTGAWGKMSLHIKLYILWMLRIK